MARIPFREGKSLSFLISPTVSLRSSGLGALSRKLETRVNSKEREREREMRRERDIYIYLGARREKERGQERERERERESAGQQRR